MNRQIKQYRVTAKSPYNEVFTEEILAESEEAVAEKLEEAGFTAVSIEEINEEIENDQYLEDPNDFVEGEIETIYGKIVEALDLDLSKELKEEEVDILVKRVFATIIKELMHPQAGNALTLFASAKIKEASYANIAALAQRAEDLVQEWLAIPNDEQ